MKNVLDKQTTHLQGIENAMKQDQVIQLTQVMLQAKTDKDLDDEIEKSNKHLESISKNSKTTADNVVYLFKNIKGQAQTQAPTLQKAILEPTSKGPKSLKELAFGTEEENKDFKTARGFLDQTGLVSRGSGSRADLYLQNRETAKKQTAVKETVKEKSAKAEESAAATFSDESSLENDRRQEQSVILLAKIEENTRGAGKGPASEKPAEASGGSSLLDGIVSMLGSGIMKAFKFLFNPKFLFKALTKVFVPALIIGSMLNGIVDAFKAFFSGGSFTDVIIAGLGGMLKVLSLGLFDAQTIKNIVNAITGFVTDYIIAPIKNFMSFLGKSFDTYIKEPIMEAFSYIGNLFTEYIVDPIKKFFAPIADFFKNIKEQVFGFLEDFGIPEVGFTIPIINKKVSIGPFYPFRPDEGTARVGGSASTSQSQDSAGNTETSTKTNTVSTEKGSTNVLMSSEKTKNDKASFSENFATFDPKTGKAMIAGDDGEKEISKRAFGKIKKSALAGGDSAAVGDIVKEDEAYQQLGFFDKRKVDLGMAKATDLLKAKSAEPSLMDKAGETAQRVKNKVSDTAFNVTETTKNTLERYGVTGGKGSAGTDKVITNPDGTTERIKKDGSKEISGAFGTKVYDKDGKLVSEKSPTFMGSSTETRADGSKVKSYELGPMSLKEESMASGGQQTTASYDLGALKVSKRETLTAKQLEERKTALAGTDPAATGNAVYNQSAQNSEAAAKSSNATQPVIVNAPTTNNTSKQSIAMPAPVRNEDSGFNKYINRSAFAF